MEPTDKPDPLNRRRSALVLEILACVVAAAILTGAFYGIARALGSYWLSR